MVRAARDQSSYFGEYPAYVPASARRERAASAAASLTKKGKSLAPVEIRGRAIAKTFWGKAWCTNLERYSDFSNRLPRGRTYVRSGSVIDLQISDDHVTALVQGTSLYTVRITIRPVELSSGVMEVITRKETGLFPPPSHIKMTCSCPDSATMCKHVAAVLYGIGARLDQKPELLFELRGVRPAELIADVAQKGLVAAGKERVKDKLLVDTDLSSLFGIDIEDTPAPAKGARTESRPDRRPRVGSTRRKSAAR